VLLEGFHRGRKLVRHRRSELGGAGGELGGGGGVGEKRFYLRPGTAGIVGVFSCDSDLAIVIVNHSGVMVVVASSHCNFSVMVIFRFIPVLSCAGNVFPVAFIIFTHIYVVVPS